MTTTSDKIQKIIADLRSWTQNYNKRCDDEESRYVKKLIDAFNKKEKILMKKIAKYNKN